MNCKIYSSMIATKYRYDMVAIRELWSWNDERPLYSQARLITVVLKEFFFNRFIFTAGDVGNHFDYYWSGSLYHSCDSCYFPCEYI